MICKFAINYNIDTIIIDNSSSSISRKFVKSIGRRCGIVITPSVNLHYPGSVALILKLLTAQYEIYKSLIHFFFENHVSSVATICQFSSWLLPLLESHNITALCLLAPSFIAQTPKVVPMFNIIMSVNETLSTGSFISLSKYADVLVFEPPYQGQIYNSNQQLLYNSFLRSLNLEKWKDNIIIISFKEINIISEYLSKYKIILLRVK